MISTWKRAARVLGVAAFAQCAIYAQTFLPSQDAYVDPGNPSANFGSTATISVGKTVPPVTAKDPPSLPTSGLIQFDLSQLPAGITSAQVQKATLVLYL